MTDRQTGYGGAFLGLAKGGATAVPGSAKSGANPALPVKNQVHNTERPPYRRLRPPPLRHHRRGCCCRCCLWTTLTIILLILLAAIAGGVLYVLYRPQLPSITLNSIRIAKFNLTDSSITSAFNFSVTFRNPNSRIDFIYDQISLSILSSNVVVGDGSFPGFIHGHNNVTTLRAGISRSDASIPDGTDISTLKSSLTNKQLALEIVLETKMQVQIGKNATKKLKVRVTCDGGVVPLPPAKAAKAVTGVRCKAKPIIKIVNWTL